jgi:Family of unknown function (DUF5709)
VTPDPDDTRVLDEEGLPDTEGPLPEKAATGDPQEGLAPPSQKPHSFLHGVTNAEQREGESIATRVEHERPDFGEEELRSSDDDRLVLVDDTEDGIEDREKDLVADVSTDEPSQSAEEAALHVVDEAPGAVDRDEDSYLESE